mgnify:CR=1 FL=1
MRIILLLILFFSCIDERDRVAHIEVTMLRIPYVPMSYSDWITPIYMYGTLTSDNYDVEGTIVRWFSDLYWDEDDSTGYYKLLCGRCDEAVWYDSDGSSDTLQIDINELEWITNEFSITDSLGNFYNLLTPINLMRDDFLTLWWSIEETVIDSQVIFLMD